MFEKELQSLDLTKNQASVYDVLIQRQSCTAGEIIKTTKLHRNIVYDTLEKLIEKGLVSYIVEKGRKVFQAQPPDVLLQIIEEKQAELDKQAEVANEIKNRVDSLNKQLESTNATLYKGVPALTNMFEQLLKENDSYCVLGAPNLSVELMPPGYWQRMNRRAKDMNMKTRMLFNESLRKWSSVMNEFSSFISIRFLPAHFDPLTEFVITSKTAYIIIWSQVPIGVVINSVDVASSYQEYFDYLWKRAKK